jgi:alkylated DNA repair dioxygenase AlkB
MFAWLLEHGHWEQPEMTIYGRRLPYARLVSRWSHAPPDTLVPAPLEDLRALLSDRYRVTFDSVSVNLYRNGRDSVAWHGDRIARTVHDPVVVTVSVGERRRLLLRPKGGGSSTAFDLGLGDLLVMGGACQRTWQHTVPKVASAGPRMSITLRHTADAFRTPETEAAEAGPGLGADA